MSIEALRELKRRLSEGPFEAASFEHIKSFFIKNNGYGL